MAKTGRPRKFNKDAALEIALKLFWRHGYEGTSVAMLAKAMKINVPSLYAAYGNKESLFLQTIERYGKINTILYQEAFQKPHLRDVVSALLNSHIELITQEALPHGCMMIQSTLVTSPSGQEVQERLNHLHALTEAWVAERIAQAQEEGELPQDADIDALASYVMTLHAGLAVQAKMGVARDKLKKTVRIALQNWPAAINA